MIACGITPKMWQVMGLLCSICTGYVVSKIRRESLVESMPFLKPAQNMFFHQSVCILVQMVQVCNHGGMWQYIVYLHDDYEFLGSKQWV